jgi:hypothetical protein
MRQRVVRSNRLGHGMLGQQLLLPVEELLAQLGKHRRRLLLAQLQTIFNRGVGALPLDRVKRTQERDGFLCDLGSRLLRFDYLATQMRLIQSSG